MFSYTVSKEADNSAFIKACSDLEKAVKISEKRIFLLMLTVHLFRYTIQIVKRLKLLMITQLMLFTLILKST